MFSNMVFVNDSWWSVGLKDQRPTTTRGRSRDDRGYLEGTIIHICTNHGCFSCTCAQWSAKAPCCFWGYSMAYRTHPSPNNGVVPWWSLNRGLRTPPTGPLDPSATSQHRNSPSSSLAQVLFSFSLCLSMCKYDSIWFNCGMFIVGDFWLRHIWHSPNISDSHDGNWCSTPQVPGVLQNRLLYHARCWWGTTPLPTYAGHGTLKQLQPLEDEPSQSLALVGFLWLLGCIIVEAAAAQLLHHTTWSLSHFLWYPSAINQAY